MHFSGANQWLIKSNSRRELETWEPHPNKPLKASLDPEEVIVVYRVGLKLVFLVISKMEIMTSFYFGTQKIILFQLWGRLQGPSAFCPHYEAFDDTANSQKQTCEPTWPSHRPCWIHRGTFIMVQIRSTEEGWEESWSWKGSYRQKKALGAAVSQAPSHTFILLASHFFITFFWLIISLPLVINNLALSPPAHGSSPGLGSPNACGYAWAWISLCQRLHPTLMLTPGHQTPHSLQRCFQLLLSFVASLFPSALLAVEKDTEF